MQIRILSKKGWQTLCLAKSKNKEEGFYISTWIG